MEIPSEIKIGPTVWQIELQDDLNESSDNCGVCLKSSNRIVIDSTQTLDEMEKTLLHELLHAMLDFAGVEYDEKLTEEQMCARLSPVLHMVLKENKVF